MADAKQSAAPKASEQVLEKGLLDQIVEQGRMAKDTGSKERGKDLVKEFVAGVLDLADDVDVPTLHISRLVFDTLEWNSDLDLVAVVGDTALRGEDEVLAQIGSDAP